MQALIAVKPEPRVVATVLFERPVIRYGRRRNRPGSTMPPETIQRLSAVDVVEAIFSHVSTYAALFRRSLRTLVLAHEIYGYDPRPHVRAIFDVLWGHTVRGWLRWRAQRRHGEVNTAGGIDAWIIDLQLFAWRHNRLVEYRYGEGELSRGTLEASDDWADATDLDVMVRGRAFRGLPLPPAVCLFASEWPLAITTPSIIACFPLREYTTYNNGIELSGAWLAEAHLDRVILANGRAADVFMRWLRQEIGRVQPPIVIGHKRRTSDDDSTSITTVGQWLLEAFEHEHARRLRMWQVREQG